MDYANHLMSAYREDNGEWELSFVWVDEDMATLFHHMMTDGVTFRTKQTGNLDLRITTISIFWDSDPFTVVHTLGGVKQFIKNEHSHQNMDIKAVET